jgi:predicted nucleic acid-binding protein
VTVVVDTSVLIDHLRGRREARDALRRVVLAGERLVGSVLTRTEVLAGVRPAESVATHALLDALDWVAVDDEIADAAGALANRFLRSHPGVDTVDYVIAATADRVSGQLWTLNVKHFPMYADLRPPY